MGDASAGTTIRNVLVKSADRAIHADVLFAVSAGHMPLTEECVTTPSGAITHHMTVTDGAAGRMEATMTRSESGGVLSWDSVYPAAAAGVRLELAARLIVAAGQQAAARARCDVRRIAARARRYQREIQFGVQFA